MENDDWKPTHRIEFRSGIHAPDTQEPDAVYLVMLCSDGGAYTRAEWDACDSAAWGITDGVWECEGQATPGGQNGTVIVEKLTAGYRRKASLNPAAGILSLTAKDLRRMPTIHHGHFDNLKIDTGPIRVWLSRPEAHGRVLYERLLNGKWVNTTKRTLANLASRSHDL